MGKTMESIINAAKTGNKFGYMMLDRMKMDCEYFLGYGNRCSKYLWSGSPDEHIKDMKAIYKAFPEELKPEWITMEDIENYERMMIK